MRKRVNKQNIKIFNRSKNVQNVVYKISNIAYKKHAKSLKNVQEK